MGSPTKLAALGSHVSVRQIRHLRPESDDPDTATVRQQITRDFGMLVPPFALHLPAPDVLCACWAMVREPTAGRRVDRAQKEAVAAAVSTRNSCPFCVDVHTSVLRAFGDPASASALAAGRSEEIADPALREVAAWARATRDPDAPLVRQPPFPAEHAPELIGTALAFHYINRMVNIFAPESPFPPGFVRVKSFARRAASPVIRRMVSNHLDPGAALDLLSPAALPDDLAWAEPDPIIADAWGRAAAAIDAAGRSVLSAPVRELVSARLRAWRGEDADLSRHWVETAVEAVSGPHRPLARLALLAAFASHQVDKQVLDDARPQPGAEGDRVLVSAAAWAGFAAARRIGGWLHRG